MINMINGEYLNAHEIIEYVKESRIEVLSHVGRHRRNLLFP